MDPQRDALLLVDVQNDFCTGGALAVPGSDHVIAALNQYVDVATERGVPIYASRDWHPAVTSHFREQGGDWPVHCVQGTAGALFHPDLRLPPDAIVISKGDQPDAHGYSAFDGQVSDGTPLSDDLQRRGVQRLLVGGLATDYCVKHSVLDALARGLQVVVLEDAVAGVNVQAGDADRAIAEMRDRGAVVTAGAALK